MFTGVVVQDLWYDGSHGQKTSGGFSGLCYRPNRSLPEGPRGSPPSLRKTTVFYPKIRSFSVFLFIYFLQMLTQVLSFQLGNYIALPGDVSGSFLTSPLPKTQMWRVNVCQTCRLQENEVAAVEPPPVVLYSTDSNTPQPESPVQPDPHPPIHHKPQDPHSQQPTHPDPHYHPDPRYPAPTDPRYPSYTERINRPDGRYSSHTTQERPTYPYHRYPVTTPRRPPVPETPVHRHASGPGVRRSCFCSMFCCSRELMTLHYSHSFTWLPWTPLRPELCGGSVVLTTCASHKLRPLEWRERSVPSSHPDSRTSTALSGKGTETDFPSSTWRYDGFFLKIITF